ncbi:MAG: prolyl oligopeptidase family serine peptidase [Flavobacteriales bacterium]|nr:prolyl oligopeptidase family serine peptidase [Flavobacteriales bacterium]
MRILLLFILLCLRLAEAAPLAAQDGKLIERTPFEWPKQFVDEMRTSMPEVDSVLVAVKVYRITYLSDGLKVKGFLAEPTKPGRYPSIIYNRGGNREFGKINAGQLLFYIVNMARWGYVVVASQYRGNDGGEGREEFGGADVNDVLNLVPVLEQVPSADTARIGMFGGSRGGLMTYLALTRTNRVKAAVVLAGMTDAVRSVAERPEMGTKVYAEVLPGYEANPDSVLATRSPVQWAQRLCPTTPILLLHGTADWRVSPRDAMDMADRLYELKRPFRMVLFEGGDHGLSEFRTETDDAMREFLDQYVRDGSTWPSLEPHGR